MRSLESFIIETWLNIQVCIYTGNMSIVMTGVLESMTRVHVTILSIWGGAGSISTAGSYLPAATCNGGVIGFLFSVLWQRSCAKDTIVCKQFAKLFHNRCTWEAIHIRPFQCRELCKISSAECRVLWQSTKPATPASVAQALYVPYHSTYKALYKHGKCSVT